MSTERVAYLKRVAGKMDYHPSTDDVRALLAEVERLTREAERHKDALFDRGERWKARAETAEADLRRAEGRLRALLDPSRSGLMVALDGNDEPTIWRGDVAILRRCVAPEAFDVLAGLLGGGS